MSSAANANRRPRAAQVLVMLAALVVLVAGLKAAQTFVVPILLAFFIATVSFPITNWLRNRRVPRSIAVMLTVLVDFAFLTGVIVFALSVVGELQARWNSYYGPLTFGKLEQAVESFANTEDQLRHWWQMNPARNPEMQSEIDTPTEEELEAAPRAEVIEYPEPEGQEDNRLAKAAELMIGQLREVQVSQIWNLGTGVLGTMVSFLGTTVLVVILTVFMLTEARMFGRRMDAICEARGPNIQRMLSALRDTQRYLGIKTAISLATGVMAGALCWAANIDFWPLWGILAFALNFIPVVGSVIAGVPPTLLALLVSGPPYALAVLGGYLLINTFLGNVLEPMLMGRRFGLSTLVVLVSVIFWGWLWGPIGMLLAVPLTMVVKVILDNSDEFRWIAVAIGKEGRRPAQESRILTEGAKEKGDEVVGETADVAGGS
ncbi:AI-2 transport protein TqsA [Haloferula luteola]|uniref:AI-2 transport protein TqsA n=1 Tax=Haloferula luteola TaxID=595692 RepID=A0A840UZ41_9BACT|nr:AI-2E family transporter [Haloferula luteola]MBB5350096.1 AI-2 transport protein TqsA [Haloferula luteola]